MDEGWGQVKVVPDLRDSGIAHWSWFPACHVVAGGGLSETETLFLRRRIEDFPLDEPGAALPFTSRLAREQGWSHVFAARVVREYKRFLILAAEAGHPVTPSEAVDQAWHLHLVYTRSYWKDLCEGILGTELHHEPTKGGSAESGRFVDWYAGTLDRYERVFSEKPPTDIWPPAARRFAESPKSRWVDLRKFWLLPKPALFLANLRREKNQPHP